MNSFSVKSKTKASQEDLRLLTSASATLLETTELKAPGLILANDDLRFPEGLSHVESPPLCVYVVGSVELLSNPSLAIVGARKATPYGLNCAKRFARIAATRGITVVSGGAIGCDQAAHAGCLEVGGQTIVVLGCGADIIYPKRAATLFGQILAEGGTLVSEAPWGSPPSRWGFRRRNRIIAGLARATLIVEAGVPSGTFSTADATLSQGKEVLAVPGSIFAKESKGANRLICQGAVPIVDDMSFEDALTQLFGLPAIGKPYCDQSDNDSVGGHHSTKTFQQQVLSALDQMPLSVEELKELCGGDVIEVIRCLSAMELAGMVVRLRDGRYSAVS